MRMCHNILRVGMSLCKRGCESNIQCWFSNFPEESSTRIFLDCWCAKAFWNYLNLSHLIQQWRCDALRDWRWLCASHLNAENLALVFYGAYTIWYCGNTLAHGKNCFNIEIVALNTKEKVSKFLHPSVKFLVTSEEVVLVGKPRRNMLLKLIVMVHSFPSPERQVSIA